MSKASEVLERLQVSNEAKSRSRGSRSGVSSPLLDLLMSGTLEDIMSERGGELYDHITGDNTLSDEKLTELLNSLISQFGLDKIKRLK